MLMNDTAKKFQSELNPDERILWSGKPYQGITIRAADWFIIPFTLIWGGLALFFAYSMITQHAPLGVILLSFLFSLVGLYVIIGRFFVDVLQRRNTYYAITDKRAVIISGVFTQQIKTLIIRNLSEIGVIVRRN